MNKKQFLAAAFCLMALAGCTQKTELPENPKDQEEYRDHQGNSWIYNAMLMRWALMPSMANGLSTTHYYYPKSDSWTDANGMKVDCSFKSECGGKIVYKIKIERKCFWENTPFIRCS